MLVIKLKKWGSFIILTVVLYSQFKNKILADSSTIIMVDALYPLTQFLDEVTSDESFNLSFSKFGPFNMMEAEKDLSGMKVHIKSYRHSFFILDPQYMVERVLMFWTGCLGVHNCVCVFVDTCNK